MVFAIGAQNAHDVESELCDLVTRSLDARRSNIVHLTHADGKLELTIRVHLYRFDCKATQVVSVQKSNKLLTAIINIDPAWSTQLCLHQQALHGTRSCVEDSAECFAL